MWADTLPDDERFVAERARRAVADADVAIVGGGYTGLWTAWHLARRDPALRIVVVEREHVGFGASGRNGGWSSAILPIGLDELADRYGHGAAHRMQSAMHATVREIGEFCAAHAPAGVYHRGGTLDVARSRPQVERLRSHLAAYHRHGFGDDDYRWLDTDETAAQVVMTDAVGAVSTPHCAAIHPLRLVHALARATERAGVTILEGVEVQRIDPHRLLTDAGPIAADVIVRATEGYTCQLPGLRRSLLPIYSLMIATEPLPDAVWDQIGLNDRPTFADGRHVIIYGQRTADGRFAFGGRGAPYHFGSRIAGEFDQDATIRRRLTEELVRLFPAVDGYAVTHHWGGVLGAPRDWTCSVDFDRATGLAAAGGYVGDGVSTTHLAGRTLATLIAGPTLDGDDELARLPWVGHRSRNWEPEPFRWAGVNLARTAARRADLHEERRGTPSRVWGSMMRALLRR
jgi:glycine/D-amino acid oxidase-like deaminating enzyme